MTSYRANTHVLEVDVEAAFATINADFTSESLEVPCFGVGGLDTADYSAIPNEASRQDLGEHAPGVGHAFDGLEPKLSTQMQGAGGAGFPSTQATATGQAILLGAVFGVDPQATGRRSTGSTVKAASTPTVTEVVETDAGAHAVNQLIPIESDNDGKFRARPIVTYATDTATLAVGLPAGELPVPTGILPGCSTLEWYDDEVGAALTSIQAEFVGQAAEDNVRFLGMPGTCSIPEKGPNEAPQFDFTFKAANFADLFARTQAPSVAPLPYSAAGGEFYLAAYGSAVPIYLDQIRLGIDFAASHDPLEDHNDEVDGVLGWMRSDTMTRMTMTIPQETATPTGLTSSAATFRESWRARKSANTADRYHFGCSWGLGQIGRGFSLYFSDLILIEKPNSSAVVNSRRSQQLVFAPVANSPSTMPRIMAAFW